MTQRIAEADGGRVWMFMDYWKRGRQEVFYVFRNNRRAGMTQFSRSMNRWLVKIDRWRGLEMYAPTEADAVCLLWSKA